MTIIKVTAAWRPQAAQLGLAYWSLTLLQNSLVGNDGNGDYK